MVDSQSITKQMVNYRMWREWRRRMLKKRKVAVRRKQLDMWNKKVMQKVVFGSFFREYIDTNFGLFHLLSSEKKNIQIVSHKCSAPLIDILEGLINVPRFIL